MSAFVAGSSLLTRALSQVGLVDTKHGDGLQDALLPGQKLVSKQGDIWRWDGYCAAADAPSAAATRLTQRNRLDELVGEIGAAETAAEATKQELETARIAVETHSAAQDEARQAAATAQSAAAEAQNHVSEAEAALATQNAKLSALQTGMARIEEDLRELDSAEKAANKDLLALGGEADLLETVEATRSAMEEARGVHGRKQAELDGLKTRREARDARLARIDEDRNQWQQRLEAGQRQGEALVAREAAVCEEMDGYKDVPAALADKRAALADLIVAAQDTRKQEADRLAEADAALTAADTLMREVQAQLSENREAQARFEATLRPIRCALTRWRNGSATRCKLNRKKPLPFPGTTPKNRSPMLRRWKPNWKIAPRAGKSRRCQFAG